MKICCPVHFIAQCQLSGYAVTKTSDDFEPTKARILLILIRIKESGGSRVFLDPKVTYRVFFELVQKGIILKFIQTFENYVWTPVTQREVFRIQQSLSLSHLKRCLA